MVGHNVSHSNRKTKRTFLPNLQSKRLINPATGKIMRVLITTSGMRTLAKWQADGKKYDLQELMKVR